VTVDPFHQDAQFIPSTGSEDVCPSCHSRFVCDLAQGCANCWCMKLPPVLPLLDGARCLCPNCLIHAISGLTESKEASKTSDGGE